MTTMIERYVAAGLPLCPGGSINEYQYQKHLGHGVFSRKDSTWVQRGRRNGRLTGEHKCCGSKRSYRHKVRCPYLKTLASDDLSDLA